MCAVDLHAGQCAVADVCPVPPHVAQGFVNALHTVQLAPSASVSCAHFGASVGAVVGSGVAVDELLCEPEELEVLEELELLDELELLEELELLDELEDVSSSTVSSYVALSLPSFAEAVIVTLPALRGFTIPVVASMDAILSSLDDHTTLPIVASSGSATTLS